MCINEYRAIMLQISTYGQTLCLSQHDCRPIYQQTTFHIWRKFICLIEGCKLISHHAKLWAVELVSLRQCFIIAPIISIRFRVRTIISSNCSFVALGSNFRSCVPCSFQAKDLQSVSISIPLMSDRRLSLKMKKYIIEIITILPQQ